VNHPLRDDSIGGHGPWRSRGLSRCRLGDLGTPWEVGAEAPNRFLGHKAPLKPAINPYGLVVYCCFFFAPSKNDAIYGKTHGFSSVMLDPVAKKTDLRGFSGDIAAPQ